MICHDRSGEVRCRHLIASARWSRFKHSSRSWSLHRLFAAPDDIDVPRVPQRRRALHERVHDHGLQTPHRVSSALPKFKQQPTGLTVASSCDDMSITRVFKGMTKTLLERKHCATRILSCYAASACGLMTLTLSTLLANDVDAVRVRCSCGSLGRPSLFRVSYAP